MQQEQSCACTPVNRTDTLPNGGWRLDNQEGNQEGGARHLVNQLNYKEFGVIGYHHVITYAKTITGIEFQ